MRIPVSWFKDFVAFDASPEELASRLTFSGLDIEGIEWLGAERPGVVVGAIAWIRPHPSADSLLLCGVDTGRGEVTVVCGARNFKAGDRVPYAGPGAILPSGTTIAEAVVRGERSAGMLCAEDELGLGEDHSGLMLLPADATPGTPFSQVVPPEPILLVEVTPNRPDCLSVIGIAREIAALYGTSLRVPEPAYAETGAPVESVARVDIKDSTRCPRYTARVFTGARLAPSPLWMRMRLLACGVRPINNIVDITNYVMIEYGQPLHAFDRTLLRNSRIVVRRARAGETMATLDGVDRAITPDMLVIADEDRPVALAGVMGGAGSEIRETTTDVLLESACFQAAGIRRTSKTLSLSTESSYRYERGVDPNLAERASRRAGQLLVELAGATAARGVVDVFPRPPKPRVVRCRFDRVRRLLGVELPAESMVSILRSLELGVEAVTRTSCRVRVPSFRGDIELEADLIEEIARLYGLDRIPARAPRSDYFSASDDSGFRAAVRGRDLLVGLGLTEIVNYSFVSEKILDLFDPGNRPRRVVLPNPVSADQSVLRPSLIPQLTATLGYNLARQCPEAALFEIGRVFLKDPATGRLNEEDRLAIGLLGPIGRPALQTRRPVEAEEIFLWLKGILESVGAALRAPPLSLEADEVPWAETGMAARVCALDGDQAAAIGHIGAVKSSIRAEWRLARPVAVLEVRFPALLRAVFGVPAAPAVAAYPAVTRDVALVVGQDTRHADIVATIRRDAPSELTQVELFDIYTGAGVGAGRKSLAYSLTYRSLERTLTDEEANRLHEEVKARVVKELKAEVRES